MAHQDNLAGLVDEVRRVGDEIAAGDTRYMKRLDMFEESLNALYKKVQRPGAEGGQPPRTMTRSSFAS